MTNQEIWKDVKGYEGLYQVSSEGRVRSVARVVTWKNQQTKTYKSRIMKIKEKNGYCAVSLYKNYKPKDSRVHRLVADAFIDNPNNLPFVNHIDEDKTNNVVTNLEWCSYSYNNNYGTRNERISQNSSRKRKIIQLDINGNKIKEWESIMKAANYYGVTRTNICAVCNDRQHTSCGYVWRYSDE